VLVQHQLEALPHDDFLLAFNGGRPPQNYDGEPLHRVIQNNQGGVLQLPYPEDPEDVLNNVFNDGDAMVEDFVHPDLELLRERLFRQGLVNIVHNEYHEQPEGVQAFILFGRDNRVHTDHHLLQWLRGCLFRNVCLDSEGRRGLLSLCVTPRETREFPTVEFGSHSFTYHVDDLINGYQSRRGTLRESGFVEVVRRSFRYFWNDNGVEFAIPTWVQACMHRMDDSYFARMGYTHFCRVDVYIDVLNYLFTNCMGLNPTFGNMNSFLDRVHREFFSEERNHSIIADTVRVFMQLRNHQRYVDESVLVDNLTTPAIRDIDQRRY